ncbi:RNA polymerase sigma factor, sigma-70 family [Saccharopolyspora kobensis]|uniref:RNA polymerase sigma factor, sigma-70 family n=1 Tax=Saccharopolyspora kobensis TaxID=146035 RepID=A0A1H6EAL5_9PSEU|nr:sigma-70 family RNA polymerase sigma factor [Saccharopolyspora kobensis]SEG94762.1 RNA polymerase sigma factor, sigma-70 family [Saccharopolyspora kobensis]SFD62945.1 RNA polymerase sigma factor, sigma-70 family [Saccharopolyspora kobensis]
MYAGDDRTLLEAVRFGSSEAFAELYARHRAAARTMAKQVAPTPADVDDLVAEAFANILDVLRRGAGPETAFRAYLLTTIRNLAAAAGNRERRVHLAAELDGLHPDEVLPFIDPAVAELERNLIKQAFTRLPRRWRHVLWYVEVENQTPAEVGRRFGISRNSAAALTYRARKGLREAYTQVCRGEPTQRRLAAPGQLLAVA